MGLRTIDTQQYNTHQYDTRQYAIMTYCHHDFLSINLFHTVDGGHICQDSCPQLTADS